VVKPLVSVVCITYNQENFIKDALDGLAVQKTDFPFEIIIGDDKSTDNTPKIILKYADKYPDIIKPILRPKNLGVNKNFVAMLKEASGKYIAFCEGDDYWIDPNKLQLQIDYMENHPKCDLVYTDLNFLYSETGEVKQSVYENNIISRPKSLEEHLHGGYIAPCTWLFRKSALNLPLISMKNWIDTTFVIALELFKKGTIHYIPKTTAVYRISDSGVSQAKGERAIQRIIGILEIQEYFIKKFNIDEERAHSVITQMVKNLVDMQWQQGVFDSNSYNQYLRYIIEIVVSSNKIIAEKDKTIAEKDRLIYEKEQKLNQIISSKSYKIGRVVTTPGRSFKRVIK